MVTSAVHPLLHLLLDCSPLFGFVRAFTLPAPRAWGCQDVPGSWACRPQSLQDGGTGAANLALLGCALLGRGPLTSTQLGAFG